MQNKDEAELIAQTLSGDRAAYGELVDRYKNAVYHHCFAIVRDEDVAEDIAQDTFITAYYKLQAYKPKYRLSTWLFTIATRKALNQLKRSSTEVSGQELVIANLASTHKTPAQQAVETELHEAVRNLEPRYRAVISLYYWQGLSYRDIATVMKVPDGSVRGWMSRAKLQLRKELS